MLSNEQLQLVDVCLPPYSHIAAITQVLEHDVNCLVEKPLTLTTADADAAIALAEKRALKLHVIQNYSALPGVLRAKALVARGEIGEVRGAHVFHLTPFAPRHLDPHHWCHSLPGDYFAEVGPHLAMLLVEFLGAVDSVDSLLTKASAFPSIIVDELRILARAEKGLGTISCSMNCPSRILTVDVWGTSGSIHVNADYQAVVLHKSIDSSMNTRARGVAALGDISSRVSALTWTSLNVLLGRYAAETMGHRYLLEQSVKTLRGESSYPIDTKLAREAVHLLELAFSE
jgi:predicted dehydrogenase